GARRAALLSGVIPAYGNRPNRGRPRFDREGIMALTAQDRTVITDLINRHGHLTDRGDFDGLRELFTDDVSYDVSALGGGVLAGLAAAREAALALGERNPVAHHVTNIVLAEAPDGAVRALSKG